MGDWVARPLESLVSEIVDRRGVTPKKLGGDFVAQGYRVISARSIRDRRVNLTGDDAKYVSEQIYRKWMRIPLQPGDVILTSEAPIGEPAYVHEAAPWCLGQRLFAIRPDPEQLDGRFLFYALQAPSVRQDLVSRGTGTTVAGIRQSELRRVSIPVPKVAEQHAIASVLAVLDDKIELNQRMSETLEQMARALFRVWFVDFDGAVDLIDSELGPIPRGWSVQAVGDVVEVVGGSTPSTKESSFWADGVHAWATPKDLSGLSVPVLLDTSRHITDAGLAKISSGLLPPGTLLLSSRAPVGYTAIAVRPMAVNQGFIAIPPGGAVSPIFMLLWAREHLDAIRSRAGGSTFAEISKRAFRPMPIVCPPAAVLAEFDSVASVLLERITVAANETSVLVQLRDTLLPKLISGEIRVPEAERVLSEVV